MSILSIIIFILIYVSSVPISNFTKPTTLPKYFAIDIDGTFFINDQTKFQRNVEAFKKLKQKNVTAFFCTGRDTHCTKNLLGDSFFNDTGYNCFPGVYSNGALVYGSDGNLISELKFEVAILEKFIKYIEDNQLKDKAIYLTKEGFYSFESLFDNGKQVLNTLKFKEPTIVTKDELKQKNVVSILIFKDNLDDCDFKNEVYKIVYKKYNYIQITPSKSNKKEGLKKLLENMGSNENECAFIGDDLNDAEVMEYCYLSFAVADSIDEVKNKAKWLLDKKHDECAFENVVKLLYDD
ncbi:haloacid dehalogenase-like family hydrolase, putative [Theileria annulata]|uniref:Haloacid dehalogenase-like family hydrolase, putative n=1 Tax=Theileria annulata TaxID=5874 RepID=Q4UIS0_THEAN|nr:haloacid dehalogenase-like family hydrolase, putative [Theileria annulata]CAI73019.1 haloacid dehalogenase-like family hydrolase, putative [Theileria annulata]|eukprot:XP_953697.1 haloacid dehalogenase-like family hydrolase, putative [Theileria annulata]